MIKKEARSVFVWFFFYTVFYQSCICVQALTEVSADVDVEVDGVVPVVHQVAIADFDQRAEVMLLPVRIKHVAGHLDTEEAVGLRMVWQ